MVLRSKFIRRIGEHPPSLLTSLTLRQTLRRTRLLILGLLVLLPAPEGPAWAYAGMSDAAPKGSETGGTLNRQQARAFVGCDLHLSGTKLVSYRSAASAGRLMAGDYVLIFPEGLLMDIGGNRFSSDGGVVWLSNETTEQQERAYAQTKARVYLEGHIKDQKSRTVQTVDLQRTTVEEGQAVVLDFDVSGKVFVTAEQRQSGLPDESELYKTAAAAMGLASLKSIESGAGAAPPAQAQQVETEKITTKPVAPQAPQGEAEAAIEERQPSFRYPINIAAAGEEPLQFESSQEADGTLIATVIGRFYVWQRQDEKGGLLELQADRAVIFYLGPKTQGDQDNVGPSGAGVENILGGGTIGAIYMAGDVVMTEGRRTIRAEELYYDFQQKKALVVEVVMRSFDVARGIPIYVRAAKLRQLAANKFQAEDIVLTSSEFYRPQISLSASRVLIADTSSIDEQEGKVSDTSYDAQMHDVRLNLDEGATLFYWPVLRSNMQRPDVPLKGIHLGHDNTWGTSFETRWYLSRLLGLREPEGTDATFNLDFYGKRGLGTGADIEYENKDSFGQLKGYFIDDHGEDRLGRISSRRNLEPERNERGRFYWLHRQFLPYNWQMTTGVSYISDEHFLESFYRNEFNTGLDQETYVHLKRIEDNWGLSLLGKGRLNDFENELEEMPGAEFHLTGQSLFDDKLTLYSDSEAAMLRQSISNVYPVAIDDDVFSFASHRTELDMPVSAGQVKMVPFVAGTYGYDDRSGFTRALVDGSDTGSFGDDNVWFTEAGVRVGTQYSRVYPGVKSRLWDLNRLRHILKPHLTAVYYDESDPAVEQRSTINTGLSQRLQTKRGPVDNPRLGVAEGEARERTVDWMSLDTDFTWVEDSADEAASVGPDRFLWNRPIVPMRVLSSPEFFNDDLISTSPSLRRVEAFGPRRNYFGADAVFRASDTLAFLADCYYDMQSGVVQQLDVGVSRLCWPDLSYYIGSRYLRRVQVLDEQGSNAFTFAVTYVLDPRYTLVFAQQFDFDYGANVRSDVTLIRRYHRIFCGITYSLDSSLDSSSIVLSIWPQGVPELAIGPRRYIGLSGPGGY